MGAKKNPFLPYRRGGFPQCPRRAFYRGNRTYDPLTAPSLIKVDLERAKYWISNGAQPTDTVRALLKKAEAKGASP
jgi:small subunit ribosomal protein S16